VYVCVCCVWCVYVCVVCVYYCVWVCVCVCVCVWGGGVGVCVCVVCVWCGGMFWGVCVWCVCTCVVCVHVSVWGCVCVVGVCACVCVCVATLPYIMSFFTTNLLTFACFSSTIRTIYRILLSLGWHVDNSFKLPRTQFSVLRFLAATAIFLGL
jgi:hypothetical protein